MGLCDAASPPSDNPEEIAEWLMADPDKAAEVWRALGVGLGLSNQRSRQEAYKRIVLAYMARLNYPMPPMEKRR